MQYITEHELSEINMSSKKMVELVDEALHIKSDSILPHKTSMKLDDGKIFYNVMPAIIENKNVAGVKIVNRYPERTPSLISNMLLYDVPSGNLKAMIEADYITTWRTAAVAVHSISLFARKNYNVISFVGLGVIGKAVLKVYLDTLDSDRNIEVRLFNYKNRANDVVYEFSNYTNVKWKCFDNYVDMAKDSDVIVSSVTYIDNDFASPSIYKDGVLIVPVHTRGFIECDTKFDKIFGDDIHHVNGFRDFDKYKYFAEVADVVNGKCVGRENDTEKILVYNIGIALHDLMFADYLYNCIVCKGV